MGAGRPLEKLYLDKGWQIKVLELYNEGASDVEVKALIYEIRGSFSNDLWDRWISDEPEFSETIKVGRMLSESWWAKSGRVNLKDKDFSYTGWYMNMKNRFGWSDRVANDHTTNGKDITSPIKWVDGTAE
jgi:hypothetical protein